MAKNELHIFKYFLLASFGRKLNLKSLNKFDPWVSMFRQSRWLCQANVFVLIFDLVQLVAALFCSGHWHNYFLQLGQAVWASVQSNFLRCLQIILIACYMPHMPNSPDHRGCILMLVGTVR